jgi:hypothetical protein
VGDARRLAGHRRRCRRRRLGREERGRHRRQLRRVHDRRHPLRRRTPNALRAIVAIRNDAGTTANLPDLRLVEGATEHATKIFAATIGSATTIYKAQIYTTKPTGGAWTHQAILDSKLRFYATDVAPVPRLKAVMYEVDVPTFQAPAPQFLSSRMSFL